LLLLATLTDEAWLLTELRLSEDRTTLFEDCLSTDDLTSEDRETLDDELLFDWLTLLEFETFVEEA